MTAREEYEACAASVRSTAITNREKEINFILARADAALAEADEESVKWQDESLKNLIRAGQAEEKLAQAEAEIAYLREREKLLGDTGMHQQKRADKAEQRVRELEEFVTFVRRTAGDQWTDNVLAITASRLTAPEPKE